MKIDIDNFKEILLNQLYNKFKNIKSTGPLKNIKRTQYNVSFKIKCWIERKQA
jgi:hypothetical protein